MMKKTVALSLAFNMAAGQAMGAYAATIPGFYGEINYKAPGINELPVARGTSWTGVNSITTDASGTQMTIDQNDSRAVIDWEKFNIGANAAVYFRQKDESGVAQTSWSALNRIHDTSPSVIYGQLKADGKVYLINQNGILFGPDSRVDVHSLTASTMNLRDSDFREGVTTKYYFDNYQGLDQSVYDVNKINAVSNHGVIAVKSGGSVYLLASTVENSGQITAPFGNIYLLSARPSTTGYADVSATVPYKNGLEGGTTINDERGALSSESGTIKLYGADVENNGAIRALTSVYQKGTIELHASDSIITGAGSVIESLISTASDTIVPSSDNPYRGGVINIGGLGLVASTTAENIVLGGSITAPFGEVSINAEKRVFIDEGGSIDVSGLWVDMPAGSNLIEVQMNSVNLRDDYSQKDGVLQGETLSINPLYGSTIGDISSYLTSAELSASEQSTRGGTIDISVTDGDIILKKGASLSFAGGGFNYAAGNQAVTKLVCGNRIYDLSTAPETYTYSKILGVQQVYHKKYGVKKVYKGFYYGGGNSLYDYAPAYSQGSDAGTLNLRAASIVLDGGINARATVGEYQIARTTDADDRVISVLAGLEQPMGGTLNIGDISPSTGDYRLGDVVLSNEVAARDDLSSDSPADMVGSTTYLSTDKLSGAGLSSITIRSNTSLTTEAGSGLTLDPGSSFTVEARRIEHNGAITTHGGEVAFKLTDNITSEHYNQINLDQTVNSSYIPLQERIYLSGGSSIDVSGNRVGNPLLTGSTNLSDYNYIEGGTISLTDTRELGAEVIVREGAVLDASGGYGISSKGTVTGGNAGTVELRAPTVVLDGTVRGYSLAGYDGGLLKLQAKQVNLVHGAPGAILDGSFTAESDLSAGISGTLTLGDEQFTDTGFGSFALNSYGDLEITSDIRFRPSYVKLATPDATGGASQGLNNLTASGVTASGTVTVDSDYAGATSFTAKAGSNLYTGSTYYDPANNNPANDPDYDAITLSLAEGALIAMAPKGSVTLGAPVAAIAGTVEAPAGSISITSSVGDLTIDSSARLSAEGYNRPNTATIAGVAVGPTPVDAGSVSLSSNRDLAIASGSKIDVSGSAPVENMQISANGLPTSVMVASNPGAVSLSFGGDLLLGGELDARGRMDYLKGGTLSVKGGTEMTLSNDFVGKLLTYNGRENGFDDVTFKSNRLLFNESIDLDFGRKLTLNAPVIMGEGASEVTLNAPWLRIINDSSALSATAPDVSAAGITVSDNVRWLDIEGEVKIYGFSDVTLKARDAARLSDHYVSADNTWYGKFYTSGNLTIQAGVVYPTTYSNYTLASDKKVTILPVEGAVSEPVYSAGGSLTIIGREGIEQRGVLKAPFGTIRLVGGTVNSNGAAQGSSRVYLAEGSVTSVAGEAQVLFGGLDEDSLLYTYSPHDTSGSVLEVTSAPEKDIEIAGSEVIVRDGATMDISGGGSIFTYLFQAGIEGSYDPFLKTTAIRTNERYVIMADNSIQTPDLGSIYISGGAGLKEGVYYILPEEYAFLPGAMVITATGSTVAPGQKLTSADGYQVVGGYATYPGTEIKSAQLKGFTVRTAADVMKEGHFEIRSFNGAEGGALTAKAPTTVMGGTVLAGGLDGYLGGTLKLSGEEIIVQSDPVELPDTFDFSSALTDLDLNGKLIVSGQTLNGNGLGEVSLGDASITNSVTVISGTVVDVPTISLTAGKTVNGITPSITVDSGAGLQGSESITLTSTTGEVSINEGSTVTAGNSLTIEANRAELEGAIATDRGSAFLISGRVYVVSDSYAASDSSPDGIYLKKGLWEGLAADGCSLTLTGDNGVTFMGDLSLSGGGSVTIDTPLLTASGQSTGLTSSGLNISATSIHLLNSGANTGGTSPAPAGTAVFTAGNITLGGESDETGNGEMVMAGFRSITLDSSGDLTLMGQGSLRTGWTASGSGRELIMKGARLVTAPYRDDSGNYKRADYTIDGSNGAVSFASSGGDPGASTWGGGKMGIIGDSIVISGIIEAPAGEIDLTANGSGGILLQQGAGIRSVGMLANTTETGKYTAYDGGIVSLSAAAGPITVETGALIDVSAAEQGDAGALSISSPTGGVTIDGDIMGTAASGQGGSFLLDTDSLYTVNNLNRFSLLNDKLDAGGFTGELVIRARTGNLAVASTDTVKAKDISLTVDSGDLTMNGKLDASGISQGGRVELIAGKTLTLASGSTIDVSGGDEGGEVRLNAGGVDAANNPVGFLDFATGATIRAAGATADSGGLVHLRAQRTASNDGMLMNYGGTVEGASRIEAEAVKVYRYEVDGGDLTGMLVEAGDFVTNYTGTLPQDVHLLTGIEIRSSGDLTFTGWDLTSSRFGGEAGVLTLRAAGDLEMSGYLTDQPTIINDYDGIVPEKSNARHSWGINLVAGADLGSSGIMAVKRGTGDLTIENGGRVYTEKSRISFAAGNDMSITDNGGMFAFDSPMVSEFISFNLGTYDGEIRGTVGNDLTLTGGVIQSAVGDIDISAGGDITLDTINGLNGAIRTTGEYASRNPYDGEDTSMYPAGYLDYWNYHGGGDITLRAVGDITTNINRFDTTTGVTRGWESVTTGADGELHWSAAFTNINYWGITTEGVAAMGGGGISVRGGGSVSGQFGAFGEGDLRVTSGGDLFGRFLTKNGANILTAGGNLAARDGEGTLIEAFRSDIRIKALGNMTLGAVVNPTIASGAFASHNNGQDYWRLDPGYEASALSLYAEYGDISILGETSFYIFDSTTLNGLKKILPPTLKAYAGGSISLSSDQIVLAPSSTGALRLVAGGDIDNSYINNIYGTLHRGAIYVSDMDPEQVYGSHPNFEIGSLFSNVYHAAEPVHLNDTGNPILISAGNDIINMRLYLPKAATIQAGNDITDIYLEGQNLHATDVSSIIAGRNITLSNRFQANPEETPKNGIYSSIIEQGGPGALLVMGGGDIDLGTTQGIQAVGNSVNFYLPGGESALYVAAGTSPDLNIETIREFFPALREAGEEYSDLLSQGDDSWRMVIAEFREGWLDKLFSNGAGGGTIDMISSQISTLSEESDIFIVSGGDINVGRSVLNLDSSSKADQKQSTGIFTSSGGAINIFAGGDVNVNESRVMTFRGGDITIWSDTGDINAGRGSKTAVSASPPQYVPIDYSDLSKGYKLVFTPPSVGSGIRAVTYDPDGVTGPDEAPPAGDIYAFSPEGVIDAGEAGIAGGKVTLGATEVLNAQNISFSAGSVGVPTGSEGAISLGALAGAGSLSEATKMAEQATIGKASEKSRQAGMVSDFLSKWLDVRVINFETDSEQVGGDRDSGEEKEKKNR